MVRTDKKNRACTYLKFENGEVRDIFLESFGNLKSPADLLTIQSHLQQPLNASELVREMTGTGAESKFDAGSPEDRHDKFVGKDTDEAQVALEQLELSQQLADQHEDSMRTIRHNYNSEHEKMLHQQRMAAQRAETRGQLRMRQALRREKANLAIRAQRLDEEHREQYRADFLTQVAAKEEQIRSEMRANREEHAKRLEKYSNDINEQSNAAYLQMQKQKEMQLQALQIGTAATLYSTAPVLSAYKDPEAKLMSDFAEDMGFLGVSANSHN